MGKAISFDDIEGRDARIETLEAENKRLHESNKVLCEQLEAVTLAGYEANSKLRAALEQVNSILADMHDADASCRFEGFSDADTGCLACVAQMEISKALTPPNRADPRGERGKYEVATRKI